MLSTGSIIIFINLKMYLNFFTFLVVCVCVCKSYFKAYMVLLSTMSMTDTGSIRFLSSILSFSPVTPLLQKKRKEKGFLSLVI